MTDFNKLRDDLTVRRKKVARQKQEVLLAGETLKRAKRILYEFERRNPSGKNDERKRLQQEVDNAQIHLGQAQSVLNELSAEESNSWGEFGNFSNPQQGIRNLSDDYPILLFPLRLETRFKKTNGQDQLWVRVFPDTCLIDSFEEALTEQEVTNAQIFWASVWHASGDEALERAAWRDLVASHGSGRSSWILKHYQPLNPEDKPEKSKDEIVLIISASGFLPIVVADYWLAVWKATGNNKALDDAYSSLMDKVGEEQANEIAEKYRPFNFSDKPGENYTYDNAPVRVVVLICRPLTNLSIRRTSWSSPSHIDLLPERLILVAYGKDDKESLREIGNLIHTPLIASPDPSASPEQQMKPVGENPDKPDKLKIPADLKWMFDFESAIKVGMAFRINITPQQAKDGFERIIVLGVRLTDSPDQGKQNLEKLLTHHLYSRAGFEIIPQGTPTNNTEKMGSGYSFHDDPDTSFDIFFRKKLQYKVESDPLLKSDGQWLAELLGIDDKLVQCFPNAKGTDQLEASAMQIALWQSTLGYAMKTLLTAVFTPGTITCTREFFTRYVSGRGPLPALRIGVQPYGILPVTAFKKVNWFRKKDDQSLYLGKLYKIIRQVEEDWTDLLDKVSYIGKPGEPDPHQTLLNVLGLHPSSVEFHSLQAESIAQKFNELAFFDGRISQKLIQNFDQTGPMELLKSFGYRGNKLPDILKTAYWSRQSPLTGPLIDDRPLSESETIRKYAGDLNYIEWLIDASHRGIEWLQQEQGFSNGRKPTALLYLMLRHALELGFYEAAFRLLGSGAPQDAQREPDFIHISDTAKSESRYETPLCSDINVTNNAPMIIGDFIARNIQNYPELYEQVSALERLKKVPTARLERVFAEHLDTVNYRLDAWKTGLISWQLENLRHSQTRQNNGIYLGAYGWLESLHPQAQAIEPVALEGDLSGAVNQPGDTPLMKDPTNEGLIHAPSLNHAKTAAVLRSGYLANNGQLAVDLSSRRVRPALSVMEGMRNGQSLGALLGYQFERYIHDKAVLSLSVHALIYPLRKAFPLVADQINKTKTNDGEAQESIAAMNVVDGRKLIEHVEKKRIYKYPFDLRPPTLPIANDNQKNIINSALAHILDINDALADLVLAESVHQAIQGNYDRSAGVLDAFAKGNYPPEPEVIRTPRSGIALTLRTAIHFSTTFPENPLPGIPLTPLALAEPTVNAWLKGRLPDPRKVGCWVAFTNHNNKEKKVFISQIDLGLQPIDLLYRIETGTDQALNQLDDCILRFIYANHFPSYDREIRILYTERVPGKITWFELQALLRSLRMLVVAARPLHPTDLMRHNDANLNMQGAVSLSKDRIQKPLKYLDKNNRGEDNAIDNLKRLALALGNEDNDIDSCIEMYVATVGPLAAYRLPQTGTGFLFEWRANMYASLVTKIYDRIKVWNDRLARFDENMQDYDALARETPQEERIKSLQAAEILIGTHLTVPVPASATSYRSTLKQKRRLFIRRRDALQDLIDSAHPTLSKLLADAKTQVSAESQPLFADFDPDPLDFGDVDASIERFRTTMADAVTRAKEVVTDRFDRTNAELSNYDTAVTSEKVERMQDAAKILFGDDFQMVPSITLPKTAADEFEQAWQYSKSEGLTNYLTKTIERDFPVDDWLHGIARVHEKLHHWENVVLLGEAFHVDKPFELIPLQLPYIDGESWLAMEFPPDTKIESDRLLYTAHFSDSYDKTKPVCGLLVDEWTEVIPNAEETTGIAFHFNRPNAEPPQTWLLALPAVSDGSWSWEELLTTVKDTLDSAKRRAIEPAHIDSTAYSWFLPATTSAYTSPEISISNNLLRNAQLPTNLPRKPR